MDINQLIKELTIEEKASLLMGKNVWWTQSIERLGIPSIMMADGPHGIRKQLSDTDNLALNQAHLATCFPTAATVACSFDRDLVYQMGKAIAKEAKSRGVSIVLGPGINIKRSPLCGRNFEYYSEDPYLTGELAYAFIKGAEDQKIGTSLKHFAFNNQEHLRMTTSSIIDERAKHEIYLKAFQTAIKANPATIMTSYNKVDDLYVGESYALLSELLRHKWGYQGVLISDWGAVSDRISALKAGLDIEMPYSGEYHTKLIVQAVKSGLLGEDVIDQSVKRILSMVNRYQVDKPKTHLFHHQLACDIAKESAVLLQNEEQILPLTSNQSILVVGEFANKPRFQGGGSSHISTNKVESFLDVLDGHKIKYEYAAGYDINQPDLYDINLIEDALVKAKGVDAIVLFIGLPDAYESEGFDRTHLNIPYPHSQLIGALKQVNPNLIVVLQCGSPIIMPWKKDVKAILHMYLSGEATNLACFSLLYGETSPSGKLAETYPLDLEDCPNYLFFPGGNHSVHYKESIYVGYRYYDTFNLEVNFPFGHGLQYTTFEYSDVSLSKTEMNHDESVELTCCIKNTGLMRAKEVVQIYVKNASSMVFKAKKELKEFIKVELEPGQSKTITITLQPESFAFYNTRIHDWHVESGLYKIEVGSSSADIRLSSDLMVFNREMIPLPNDQVGSKSYYTGELSKLPHNEWVHLLGYQPIPEHIEVKRPFTLDATLEDVRHTFFGKILNKIVVTEMTKSMVEQEESMKTMMSSIVKEQPLRSLVAMGGGAITKEEMLGMLEMINGHLWRGLSTYRKARKQKNIHYNKKH